LREAKVLHVAWRFGGEFKALPVGPETFFYFIESSRNSVFFGGGAQIICRSL
jgi:hypothetical protein